ncbi:MAG: response regulator [Nitrospinae bacterium]|nr:response regulator [Nitrospinota bacterium]MBF0633064.1 response regulator [Nitrospinota bacterium]
MAKRVLIAEDEDDIRRAYERMLTLDGYEFYSVSTGAEMLEEAMSGEYDLILSDVRMPKGYGDDILHILQEKGVKTPAIVVSAIMPHTRLPQNVSALSKPFDMTELRKKVADILAR